MYSKQADYDRQLKTLGIMADDAYTCTCYMDEVGNIPNEGDILSWAESSAVVYANSVLGARCNRNSGILDLFGSIVGCVPYFGLLTDDGRKADWLIEVRTSSRPEAQLLGSAIGMKVMEQVPYVTGLDRYFSELDDEAKAYFKDFGDRAYIYGVLVYERYRGLGYGKKLLRGLLRILRDQGYASCFLQVSSENIPAMRLYLGEGFETTEKLDLYQKNL